MKMMLASLVLLLSLAACAPEYPGYCDYCKKAQADISRGSCAVCKGSHTYCPIDRPLLWLDSGVYRLHACPAPEVQR